MELSVLSNIADWTAGLEDIYRRKIPFATVRALNATVDDLRDYHQSIMPTIFDRPTRYTLNSLRVHKASTRRELVAGIYFKDQARRRQHYLVPQVEGGTRALKPFEYWLIQRGIMKSGEYAVPASGLKLDSYGNVPNGTITMILSQLAAGPDAFQWETARSRKRAGSSRSRYFVPQPGSSLRRGIWRRKGQRSIEPVFIFVSAPSYQKRYPFYQLSQQKAAELLPMHFAWFMDAEIADQRAYRLSQGMPGPASNWSMP